MNLLANHEVNYIYSRRKSKSLNLLSRVDVYPTDFQREEKVVVRRAEKASDYLFGPDEYSTYQVKWKY